MTTAFLPRPTHVEWRALYRAAILETDKTIIPQKVSEAETAVLARGREIFYGPGTVDEKEALEDALYALRAFRNSLDHAEASEAA